jgi:hypothetical protein
MSSRSSPVPKGDYVNKNTASINAIFNVNLAKKALREFLQDINVPCIDDTKDDTEGQDMKIMNAHYAYTAIAEIITLYVVRASLKYNNKSSVKADLYEVTYENILQGVRDAKSFDPRIKEYVSAFNPEGINYTSKFFVTTSTLRNFIESKTFPNTTNIHFNKGAINCICYVLSQAMASLTTSAYILSKFAKKKSIQIRAFEFASIECFSHDLRKLIIQRISEINTIFAGMKENADIDDEQDEPEEPEPDDAEQEEQDE